LAANQTVYLVVDDAGCNPGSSFTVEVTHTAAETQSAANNEPTLAEPLRCGMAGYIDFPDDIDYYSLGAPAPGSRVFALLDGEAADFATDFDLRITTETETLEYDHDNNDRLFGSFSPNVAGTPLSGEPTYVQVSYRDPRAKSGPYRLYVAVQPSLPAAVHETEPNDSTDVANESDMNYFLGELSGPSPSTDADLYKFSADAGTLIFLSLDGNPSRTKAIDAKLELLDAESHVLVSVDSDPGFPSANSNPDPGNLLATRPFSPAEGLIYRTPVDGTFYARVSVGGAIDPDSEGAGEYLLSVTKDCPICCATARFVAIDRQGPCPTKLTLRGEPFATYAIESSSDLQTWKQAGLGTAGADGLLEYCDSRDTGSVQFYRAQQMQ
jgi:hypothetical protein